MNTVVGLALRNLARRKMRTWLTFGMILTGTALIVFSVGLAEGTYRDMIRISTSTWTGHFQVTAPGFIDSPSLFKSIANPQADAAALIAHPLVEAVSPRVETAGLFSAGNRTTGAALIGVDPEGEQKVSTIARTLVEGRWLDDASATGQPGTIPVVLGKGIARRLKVGPGDEVSFVGQAADGSIAAELFTVAGIIESGSQELDATTALVPINAARELLVMGGRAHRLIGRVTELTEVDLVGNSVSLGEGSVFLPWREVTPSLYNTIESDRAGLWIFLVILMAVTALGVANTMMMVVLERTREFGVMMALGTSPRRVVAMVLAEAAWLSAVSVVAGIVLGTIFIMLTWKWGIPVGPEPITYGGVEMSVMRAANTLDALIIAPLLIMASGIAAGVLPAMRAARLNPAEALRSD
jgi:ABC-type lipoprotein release transport system permease subunit